VALSFSWSCGSSPCTCVVVEVRLAADPRGSRGGSSLHAVPRCFPKHTPGRSRGSCVQRIRSSIGGRSRNSRSRNVVTYASGSARWVHVREERVQPLRVEPVPQHLVRVLRGLREHHERALLSTDHGAAQKLGVERGRTRTAAARAPPCRRKNSRDQTLMETVIGILCLSATRGRVDHSSPKSAQAVGHPGGFVLAITTFLKHG
jgi:hypothetical protein